MVYIPLKINEVYKIESFIVARINSETFLNLCKAQDYKAYPIEGEVLEMTSEKYALLFMRMDMEVFGTSKFTITDPNIFAEVGEDPVTGKRILSMKIKAVGPSSSYCMNLPGDACTCADRSHCDWESGCRECSVQFCFDIYLGGGETGDPDNPTFPPTGGSPTGGGSTGGEIPHSYPCPPDTTLSVQPDEPAPTCTPPAPGTGWIPTPPNYPEGYNPLKADTVIFDASTDPYPCLKKIVDTLSTYGNLNAKAQIALSTIFGVHKNIHTRIAFKDSLRGSMTMGYSSTDSAWSSDIDDIDFYSTIWLNPDLFTNGTKESIAATLVHESMHAYIDYIFKKYAADQIDSSYIKTTFPLFWRKIGYTSSERQQHNLMAQNWVKNISEALKSFSNSPGQTHTMRDSIYRSLAWGGLQETDIFERHPGRCDILAINFVSIFRNSPRPVAIDFSPKFPECTDQYQFDASSLKLRNPCD